jgi:FdhD protein
LIRRVPILRHSQGASAATSDSVAVEEPLAIFLDGQPLATLMRTPGDDTSLARGFLFSEGLIQSPGDIASVEITAHPTSQEIHIVRHAGAKHLVPLARQFHLTSSCGVCGRASIQQILDHIPAIQPIGVAAADIPPLLAELDQRQTLFRQSGGVHAAALFTSGGELLRVREDVGRHNALDKLIGADLNALPLADTILLMTSRASFDILQKSAMAGIPVVATIGAASSLAVELARASGIRLFSFVREFTLNEFPIETG